jgi:hypothetical protein
MFLIIPLETADSVRSLAGILILSRYIDYSTFSSRTIGLLCLGAIESNL